MALDHFGRQIHYLRISLTDHCNLRCIYCMPEGVVFRPNVEVMREDEILALVTVFASLGFDKFRLTGGEPTVRPHLVELVAGIAAVPGVRWLSMTTNGVLFAPLAQQLVKAGLQRANFSLDTLNPEKFHQLTRRGSIEDVWEGIQAAEQVGLTPIKINSVVVRDSNEDDMVDLARLTLKHPWHIRFIEMMPFAGRTDFQRNQVVSAEEMKARIEAEVGPLEPVDGGRLDGEARLFRFRGAPGKVGFIASVTQPFCESCTRARLTADGHLRLCLLREDEVDLLTPLRAGASFTQMRELVREGIWRKPWGHQLSQGKVALNRSMSEIGG